MFLSQLPITVSIGRPSRVELLGMSGCALLMVSAVIWTRTAAQQPPPATAEPPPETAPLDIISTPSGADLSIDGQARGVTPATLAVVPGRHDIVLQVQDAVDESRTVDVGADGSSLAATPLSQPTVSVVVDRPTEEQPQQTQSATPDPAPAGIVHRVQSGETLGGISRQYYGHAGFWPVVFDANRGAIMAQPAFGVGTPIRLTSPDYLLPDWNALIPPVDDHLEVGDQGELFYIVQRGETVTGIAQRFSVSVDDLVAANLGAQTPDGHVFSDPDLVWQGLRLQIRPAITPAEVVPTEPPAEAAPVATPAAAQMTVAPSPSATPTAEASTSEAVTEQPAPTKLLVTQVEPTVEPNVEMPARPRAGEHSLVQWPIVLGAGGLSGALLLAMRARRSSRTPAAAENDTQVDVDAFTLAEPAAVVSARRGGDDDPHGVVLGERLAGGLLRHTRAAGIERARIVSVKVGRTGCTVTLEAPLEERPRLEAILRTALHLARRLTVARSADQDVLVELEGIQRGAVARVRLEECPLLLCIGLQPDTRAYLAGWQSLGHLIVATQAGTRDAHEHLAALVATLAGQCPPAELQLYTLAPGGTLLGELGALPHQRMVVDPGERVAALQLLADLRVELERRQSQALVPGDPELVLVISEFADVVSDEDLFYLLTHGREYRVRVAAATADTAAEREAVADLFDSRLVFALDDEEASTRLLGKPWALTLAEPGRLLARLGRRKEVEILGLHLTEDGRRDLLASMRASDGTAPVDSSTGEHVVGGELEHDEDIEPQPEPAATMPFANEAFREQAANNEVNQNGHAAVGEPATGAAASVVSPWPVPTPRVRANGHTVGMPAAAPEPSPPECPERIARLLERARLVIDCENAVVWSPTGQLQLGQSSPIEVLFRLAAAPLLEQGPLNWWSGVRADEVLDELWAPRARTPANRESGQTWLGKNLERLQEDVRRAAGSLEADLLVRGPGTLRVNPDVAISDVEAFMQAVERARAAQGSEQRIALAEEALALRVPDLLPRAYVERTVIGKKIQLYRWLEEPHWERATRRLAAFGNEVTGLLARSYRDGGRHDEALVMYAQLLGDDPLDRRAHEGLLVAAAGTGDVAQLDEAWQQVCVCLGGECDSETRGLYERLVRDTEAASNARRSGIAVAAGNGSR